MNEHSASMQWPALSGPWTRITRSFWLAFFSACLIGTVTHLYIFTNLLLNHDSATQMWSNNDVLHLGRWSLEYLSLLSTYFQLPVVIGLLSVLALGVAAGLTVRVLELSHPVHIILASAFLVTWPSTAAVFSYLFTADAYYICLMLNALAVYCTKKYRFGWVAALFLMAVACGTYQAFVSYAIGLFLFDCILMLLKDEPLPQVLRRGVGYMLLCAASLILYYVILNLLLLVTGTQLADYQGVSGISLENLGLFLKQIPLAYLLFGKGILLPDYMEPVFQGFQCLSVVFALVLALRLVWVRKLWQDLPRLLLLLAGAALIPLALNFVTVLSVGAEVHDVMTYSFVLFFLMVVKCAELVMTDCLQRGSGRWTGFFFVNLALCAALVWGNFCTVNTAYLRMQIRYENTIAAANRIMARIESLEGYTPDTPVALVGYLPINLYGRTVPAFSDPEPITGTDDTILLSYYSATAIMRDYVGLHMPAMTAEQWDAVYNSGLLDEMPCYPSAGSVILHDGVAVVKLNQPAQ